VILWLAHQQGKVEIAGDERHGTFVALGDEAVDDLGVAAAGLADASTLLEIAKSDSLVSIGSAAPGSLRFDRNALLKSA